MPNNVHSFSDVNNDFRRAGMTLLNSRLWTEAPYNQFKLTQLYAYYEYMGRNKLYIGKINRYLNLGNIPYKTELVFED
jgi:hypothetical protein